MKYIVNEQVALSQPLEGPLKAHIAGFAQWASEQGYALSYVHRKVMIAACFSRWLGQRQVRLRDISREHVARYMRCRARRLRPHQGDTAALRQLTDLLRHRGLIPTHRTERRRVTPVERCAEAFARFLREERGLASATVVNYVPFIRCFLQNRFGKDRVSLSRLSAGDVVNFVQRQAPRLHLKRAKLLTTALRSFLRYARYRGDITLDLAAAVPTVANWSMTTIPRAIAANQVRRLLAGIDRRTATGRRDYAIVLLLARLGLRASEGAFLELDDIAVAGRCAMNSLRIAAREYLTMRRNLGFKMHGADKPLLDFITFLEKNGAVYITRQLALTWAQQPSRARPAEWARRLRLVRGFAIHRSATDPRTDVPPSGLLPHRAQRARPYLYTHKEIRRLLNAAREMTPGAGLRPWTYYCFFGLLSVSGLRVGEARDLELRDVDLKQGLLTVRGAKFGKSRLVPLHASTCKVLADYIARRERFLSGRQACHLFISQRGNRLDGGEIRRTFYTLSRKIGLRGPSDSHGPRLHDMRHRFAVQTLVRWYRAGEDAERRLPSLSAYLGHVHVADTYWYLSQWPELMREAMQRLERRWEDQP